MPPGGSVSRRRVMLVCVVAAGLLLRPPAPAVAPCAAPRPSWIWCDDFEQDRLARYFEAPTGRGSFARVPGAGVNGSYGMRARWQPGQVGAGALHLAFGHVPQPYFRPVDAGTATYRELYWRVYLRRAPGWSGGGGNKLMRATSFVSATSWAQAMAAHVWSGGARAPDILVVDPASGTDPTGAVRTATYNDVARFRWLGAARGTAPVFADSTAGRWFCLEAHVRLNDPGRADGAFELWVDGRLDARREGLDWTGAGAGAGFGLNALFIENYWNAGAPGARERVFDNLLVATAPIGC